MLRDRVVCDIEDPKIQQRLLAEPDLTFDKAFELALASESADQNAKDLQATKSPQISLNRMQIKQTKLCYRCRGNHKAIDCPHKSSECHKCGKKGYLAHVCRSKKPVKRNPALNKIPSILELHMCWLRTQMNTPCLISLDPQYNPC